MRKDIVKVITERGSCGNYPTKGSEPEFKNEDGELIGPSRVSISKLQKRNWNGKESRLNLNYLKRFLVSKIGENWDKTYSELKQAFKSETGEFLEINRLIDWWVATNTHLNEEGIVVVHDRYNGSQLVENSHSDYYVHPTTRVLMKVPVVIRSKRKNKKEREAQANNSSPIIEVSDTKRLAKIDGIWYEITLSAIPDKGSSEALAAIDVLTGSPPYFEGRRGSEKEHRFKSLYRTSGVYASAKRQLAHRELTRLNLTNQPME